MNETLEKIKEVSQKFLEKSKNKRILVISHFDTDGITSAAIAVRLLKKLDLEFEIKIIKTLTKELIENLPKNKIILFLDLASNSLEELSKTGIDSIFIIDHHEINQIIPENVEIINPHLTDNEKISSSGLTYLFSKELEPSLEGIAKLAVLGMVGDTLEKEIDKINHNIINNEDIQIRKGLKIYPSTRPINIALRYSSSPYIEGVTGNIEGIKELLRESGITPENNKYPSILELDEEQTKRIVTSILLRNKKIKIENLIGNIFLLKFFNKLEDAREMSAMINACSRLGEPYIALKMCLEDRESKKRAEAIHAKYKKELLDSLSKIEELEKIEGKDFVIINGKDRIRDTIAGTIASILSNSPRYEEGSAITILAYDNKKIKISMRIIEKSEKNAKEILEGVIKKIGGEIGGHKNAAGAVIEKTKEKEFIKLLEENLKIEKISSKIIT